MKNWLLVSLLAGTTLFANVSKRKLTSEPPVIVENPYTYSYGIIESAQVFEYKKDTFTAIQVHPMPETGTTMYDAQITLCGDQSGKLMEIAKGHLVVITYNKTIHPELCYDLVGVDMVNRYEQP